MAGWDDGSDSQERDNSSAIALAVALAAVAAVGVGFAIQKLMDRRLTTPEMARLRFYRYLREKGRLES